LTFFEPMAALAMLRSRKAMPLVSASIGMPVAVATPCSCWTCAGRHAELLREVLDLLRRLAHLVDPLGDAVDREHRDVDLGELLGPHLEGADGLGALVDPVIIRRCRGAAPPAATLASSMPAASFLASRRRHEPSPSGPSGPSCWR
jgi:hypothetical protein